MDTTALISRRKHPLYKRKYPPFFQQTHETKSQPVLLYSNRNIKTSSGVTSTLISQLAVLALKVRLQKHAGVQCDVESSMSSLLKSSIGPVSVKGKDWASPLGLTCRYIEANVDQCQLDMNSVLQKRKLILVKPAIGKSMISLNAQDFGNFLTHPLLVQQAPIVEGRGKFDFLSRDVMIEDDRVQFYGTLMGEVFRCELKRCTLQKAKIDVFHVPSLTSSSLSSSFSRDMESVASESSTVISNFFNNLVFELDGTFLRFRDMKIHSSDTSQSPIVLMALSITVQKFPSPGIAF